MTDPKIQQAIDACRPRGDDLLLPELDFLAQAVRSDPEVRRQYQRSQQFDACISGAFCDVPIPAGLADRLLAAVGTSPDQTPAIPAELPSPPSSGVASRQDSEPRRRWLRGVRPRTWATMAGSLAAAAALIGFLLVGQHFGVTEPVADERLPGEILAWDDAVVRQGWNDNVRATEPGERPLDPAVRGVPRRWCQIATRYDSKTIVYDLAPPGADQAVVFCMRSKARTTSLPNAPPWKAFSASGGLTLGVWRHGDMVYVLAVRGGPRRYREFIEASPWIGFRSGTGHPFSLIAKA